MKRLLIAVFLIVWSVGAALAQQPANGSLWNGQSSGGPLWTVNPTIKGTMTINPPSGTTTQSLVTGNTAPSSGSQSTALSFNLLQATNPGYAVSGSSVDSFGFLPNITTLRVNYTTGVNLGVQGGLAVGATETSASDLFASASGAYVNIGAPTHYFWGVIGFAEANASANVKALIGVEGEIPTNTGSTVAYQVGVSANSQRVGSVASSLNTAFAIDTGGSGFGAAQPWANGITLTTNLYNQGAPLTTSGNVIFSDAAFTTGSFANLSNITFTGDILNFANLRFTGDGHAVIGSNTAPVANDILHITAASSGEADIFASTNTTSGVDVIQIADSSTNNGLVAGVAEAANTVTRFGQTAGNFSFVQNFGTTSAGMLLGTITNKPLIIGTNNAARITMLGNGDIGIGTETNPQYQQVVSANGTPGLTAGSLATTMALYAAANGTSTNFAEASYGIGVNSGIALFSARGTAASPSQSLSGDVLGFYASAGYTSAPGWDTAPLSGVAVIASENHTLTAQGTTVQFFTVAAGGTARASEMTIGAGVVVGTTGTDEGTGTLNVHTGYYINNAPGLTQTCTVNQAKTLIFTAGILTGGTCNS